MSERLFRDIGALIFDFDGTLVDASIPICRSFNAALEEFGTGAIDESRIRAMIGRPLKEMFPAVIPSLNDDDIEWLIAAYRRVFTPIACDLSKPITGLHEMLSHFHGSVRLGIATSRISDGAQRILGAMDVLHCFDVIIGLQDVQQSKPHPEPVLKALAAVSVDPRNGVMIGDVPADMQAGKAAGAYAVGVISEQYDATALREAGADYTITRLDELIDLVEPINGR